MSDIKKQDSYLDIIKHSFKENIRQYTMVIALIAIWLIFTVLVLMKNGQQQFLQPRNLSNLILQSATIAILACGMTLVLVAGHLDLSVGSVAGFVGAICAYLIFYRKWPAIPVIGAGILVGALIGAWHGFLVAYQRIPAFIVTLASMSIFRGGILGVTGGKTTDAQDPLFKAIGQNYIPSDLFFFRALDAQGHVINSSSNMVAGWAWVSDIKDGVVLSLNKMFIVKDNSTGIEDLTHPWFNDLSIFIALVVIVVFIIFQLRQRKSRIKYGFSILPVRLEILKLLAISLCFCAFFSIMIFYQGISYAAILVVLVALVFTFISKKTPIGRHIYAIGGNSEAARLSGINIQKTTFILFVVMGIVTALAGIVCTSRLAAASTSAGTGFELDAIAASIIGGTSTMGGIGTVFGAVIGALVMESLSNGMSMLNMDITWQLVAKGVVLLIAVKVDVLTRKSK